MAANEGSVSAAPTASPRTTTDFPAIQPASEPTNSFVPKKRKFPPITKNKLPVTAGTTASTSAVTAASKPPPPSSAIQQWQTAFSGVQDFDLRDSRIYAELFKAGGNTPRSGLSRREKEEERRKELDKMRDEARAKRAGEAKHTFDLQAQAEKIARFERRLRAENSSVLHPNFLAAKFRDEWEMERRRRRDDREINVTREEGEA